MMNNTARFRSIISDPPNVIMGVALISMLVGGGLISSHFEAKAEEFNLQANSVSGYTLSEQESLHLKNEGSVLIADQKRVIKITDISSGTDLKLKIEIFLPEKDHR